MRVGYSRGHTYVSMPLWQWALIAPFRMMAEIVRWFFIAGYYMLKWSTIGIWYLLKYAYAVPAVWLGRGIRHTYRLGRAARARRQLTQREEPLD